MAHSSMQSLLDLYRSRRVFVTGHTGFKGSWLSLWLSELGAEVTGFALPAADQQLGNAAGVRHLNRHIEGDIRDSDALNRAIEISQPEVVFHLAAQPIVRLSYDCPSDTFSTNVQGSVNLLDAVRRCPSARSLIFVTSDKCYRNREWVWGYRETDELGGIDPYSASKAAAELIFSSYLESFFRRRPGFGAASARAGNVIGGGDWARDRIVPDCIRALQRDEPIRLRNPLATRPWQHVLEPLWGYMLLGIRLLEDPDRYSGAWNFGPSPESVRTVHDLAKVVLRCWGSGELEAAVEQGAAHEATLLHLSCDKAMHVLGWEPRWHFDDAVRNTVNWYRAVHDGATPFQLCRRQILEYSGAVQ